MTDKKTSNFDKSKKYYAIIGAVILGIAVIHFGMQMTFIQKETLRSFESVIDAEEVQVIDTEENLLPEKVIEIKPEQVAVKEIEIIKDREILKTAPRRQKEFPVVSERKIVRKKDMTDTRSERLRRAERILTGI